MNARVYIWIEGENFSPKEFQGKVDCAFTGTVAYRKKLKKGTVQKTREHWKSPFYEVNDQQDAVKKIHELITRLRPALLEIQDRTTIICAEIVCHYSGSDDGHGGIYLPRETIQLLSEIGASLDVDEYFETKTC